MPNEADTCRTMITPRLQAVGWDTDPHVLAEQRLITHGRIIPVGQRYKRKARMASWQRYTTGTTRVRGQFAIFRSWSLEKMRLIVCRSMVAAAVPWLVWTCGAEWGSTCKS